MYERIEGNLQNGSLHRPDDVLKKKKADTDKEESSSQWGS